MQTDIHLLTSAIEQINTDINTLCCRRSQLFTQLNTLASATRHLPAEILTEIFRLYACKTSMREPEQLYYVDFYSVLRVGRICRQWRRVAWSASRLWTTCLLTPPLLNGTLYKAVPVDLVSVAFWNCQPNNAGGVSVRVDLDNMCPDRMNVLFDQHRKQIGALRVYLPDEHWADWWNRLARYFTDEDLPKLRELWVCWPEPLRGREIRGQALTDICPGAGSVGSATRCMPWRVQLSQLNVLRLCHIPVDQCVKLLLQCSNLVEFHCEDPTSPPRLFDPVGLLPISDRPKSLPNIKRFRWRASDEDWNVFLFSSVRFPRLERLFLGFAASPSRDMLRVLNDFFVPSLTSIQALDLESTMPTRTDFGCIVECTSFDALEKLYIVTSTYHKFVTWLELLTISPNSRLLPRMTVLHVDIRSLDISEPRAFAALRRFLTSRQGPHGNPPQLERLIIETCQAPLRLEGDQMDVLSRFVADGLIIEVVPQTLGEEGIRTIF